MNLLFFKAGEYPAAVMEDKSWTAETVARPEVAITLGALFHTTGYIPHDKEHKLRTAENKALHQGGGL